MSRKYLFDFRSPDLPFDLRFWTRGFLLVMRSRKAGLPCATRARKRELSIKEGRIENDSDQKFSKTKFLQKFFWKPLFSTIYVTLIIMSRKYLFDFRSPDLPFDLRFWTRGFLLVMRSREAGLPCATRARKRELSIQEGRIENDSDQKFSKTKFVQSFSENHFFPQFMSPWSLWAENIFRFFKSGPEGFPIMSVNVR